MFASSTIQNLLLSLAGLNLSSPSVLKENYDRTSGLGYVTVMSFANNVPNCLEMYFVSKLT